MIRDYYPLVTAAEMIGCSTDDLIHLGGLGKIKLIVIVAGRAGFSCDTEYRQTAEKPLLEVIEDAYCIVPRTLLVTYEADRTAGIEHHLSSALKSDDSGHYWRLSGKNDSIRLDDNSLFVLTGDIKLLLGAQINKPPSMTLDNYAKLRALNHALQFWVNADRDDKTTWPDTKDVVGFLSHKGFSDTLARSGASIARPDWAVTGRMPR